MAGMSAAVKGSELVDPTVATRVAPSAAPSAASTADAKAGQWVEKMDPRLAVGKAVPTVGKMELKLVVAWADCWVAQ